METLKNSAIQKPPYLLGLICLIPLIGAFVGLGLLIVGLFRYKDKWLSIIGAAGIAWTILVYSSFFYLFTNSVLVKDSFTDISQIQLNRLVKDVEFYKLLHGQYPESLEQLQKDDATAVILDPIKGLNIKAYSAFMYEKVGEKYKLYSVGQDNIPNTKDDLFPQIKPYTNRKIGLIENH